MQICFSVVLLKLTPNTSPKRLDLCCLIDGLGSGGAQRQMVRLVNALAVLGHRIRLITYFPDLDHFLSEIDLSRVEVISQRSKSKTTRLLSIRRTIRSSPPDCIISFLDTPNIIAIASSFGAKPIPVIVSERSYSLSGVNTATWVRFNTFRWASKIVTNSFAQAQFIT
ncbi:MAG: glycosyltransferase, partial [Planctomycetota bacterium]